MEAGKSAYRNHEDDADHVALIDGLRVVQEMPIYVAHRQSHGTRRAGEGNEDGVYTHYLTTTALGRRMDLEMKGGILTGKISMPRPTK